jgi:hypothetical protein
MASLTGGRLTRSTNDYTIGYARARRDLGCRYTLAFYDRHPEADKRHRMEVISHRLGVHLYYAARYTFPSATQRRTRNLEAAYLVPSQFEGGGLRAHLFPVQLKDAKTWSAILAVDFPADLGDGPGPVTREFGVVLRRGPNTALKFNRTITLGRPAGASKGAVPRVTFVEPVDLAPGAYALTAVLTDPSGETPYGTASDLTLPPIPKRDAILAGPILGRRRGDDVVVYGAAAADDPSGDRVGQRDSFRPLLIDDVNRAEPLAALTNACVVKAKPGDGPWSVSRRLLTSSGEDAGSLADFAFGARKRDRNAPVQCERLFDEIPVLNLMPGAYTFRAVLATLGEDLADATVVEVPFAVGAGAAKE